MQAMKEEAASHPATEKNLQAWVFRRAEGGPFGGHPFLIYGATGWTKHLGELSGVWKF